MTAFISVASVWGLVLWIFLRGRLGPSVQAWSRSIAFKPAAPTSADELFGYLLSGNFALLLRDNFNQLRSALSKRRIFQVLQEHWGITTPIDCRRVIQARIESLGRMSPIEKRAIAAWLVDAPIDSNEYAALDDTCKFMALRAHIAQMDDLRHGHLSVLAWDLQQLAYLVRLACAVDHVSEASAEEVLAVLTERARANFASWKDYSLCALVGLGLRGSLEVFDHAEWALFARTHTVFLNPRGSPTRHASHWGDVRRPRPVPSASAGFEPWRLRTDW